MNLSIQNQLIAGLWAFLLVVSLATAAPAALCWLCGAVMVWKGLQSAAITAFEAREMRARRDLAGNWSAGRRRRR